MFRHPKPRTRRSSTGVILLLAVLLVRAAIPSGFMPAVDSPWSLRICSADLSSAEAAIVLGYPTASHAVRHGHSADAPCPFACAPAAAPPSAFSVPTRIAFLARQTVLPESPPLDTRIERAHPVRGPPKSA